MAPHPALLCWGPSVGFRFRPGFSPPRGPCTFALRPIRLSATTASLPLMALHWRVRQISSGFVLISSKSSNIRYVYQCVPAGCGDTLTSPSGIISSPGHPNSYPHGANCTWYINVTPGNLVRLTFDSFNLEFHVNCDFDYVEVYDNGTVQTGTSIGRYSHSF